MPPKEKTADDAQTPPASAATTADATADTKADVAPDAPAQEQAQQPDALAPGTVLPPAAPDAPASITTADVAPVLGVTSGQPKVAKPEPFLSEGMRQEIELRGEAVDPASGARFTKDPETGEITVKK